jgi:hypothetical protein
VFLCVHNFCPRNRNTNLFFEQLILRTTPHNGVCTEYKITQTGYVYSVADVCFHCQHRRSQDDHHLIEPCKTVCAHTPCSSGRETCLVHIFTLTYNHICNCASVYVVSSYNRPNNPTFVHLKCSTGDPPSPCTNHRAPSTRIRRLRIRLQQPPITHIHSMKAEVVAVSRLLPRRFGRTCPI